MTRHQTIQNINESLVTFSDTELTEMWLAIQSISYDDQLTLDEIL